MNPSRQIRSSLPTGRLVLLIVTALAVTGFGLFVFLFSGWSTLSVEPPADAAARFAAALSAGASGPAYLTVSAGGQVAVHRGMESASPVRLRTLHVMAWDPGSGRLLTIAFPFWFVRAKMKATINLGTLLSATFGDRVDIDLGITQEDLQRRGPGLVLDHTIPGGGRVLIWTE